MKPTAVPLLALCPRCGPFETGVWADLRGGSILGNSYQCPRCGTPARLQDVVDGVVQPFIIRVLHAVREASVDELERAGRLARDAASGAVQAKDVEERGKGINPLLRKVLSEAAKWGAAGLVAAAVQIAIDMKSNAGDDAFEAEVRKEWDRQAARDERVIAALDKLAKMQVDAPPPVQVVPGKPPAPARPSTTPGPHTDRSGSPFTRRLTPDELKAWWRAQGGH